MVGDIIYTKMPEIVEEEKEGMCPYCYEGTLALDKYSNKIYCKQCNKSIKLDTFIKDKKIKEEEKIKIIIHEYQDVLENLNNYYAYGLTEDKPKL